LLSEVNLLPPDRTGALARIDFVNRLVNGDYDERAFHMKLGALEIEVGFTFQADGSADAITVAPPEGVVCVPSCYLVVQETFTGTIWLYDHEGVGS
jgi:hypothetical protein